MRIVIAEDSVLLRDGLTRMLTDGGFDVVEAVAYFIVSEALTNVAKHAQASQAEVSVTRKGTLLKIAVTDNGCGGAAASADTASGRGTGLTGLMQRAASVDGTLRIDSPPGGPTVITAELPCGS